MSVLWRFFAILIFALLSACTVTDGVVIPNKGVSVYVQESQGSYGNGITVNMNGSVSINPAFQITACNDTHIPDNIVKQLIFNASNYTLQQIDDTTRCSADSTTDDDAIFISNWPQTAPMQLWLTFPESQVSSLVTSTQSDTNQALQYAQGVVAGNGDMYGYMYIYTGSAAEPGGQQVCLIDPVESQFASRGGNAAVVGTLNDAFLELKSGRCNLFFGSTQSMHSLYLALGQAGYKVDFPSSTSEWMTSSEYQQKYAASIQASQALQAQQAEQQQAQQQALQKAEQTHPYILTLTCTINGQNTGSPAVCFADDTGSLCGRTNCEGNGSMEISDGDGDETLSTFQISNASEFLLTNHFAITVETGGGSGPFTLEVKIRDLSNNVIFDQAVSGNFQTIQANQ